MSTKNKSAGTQFTPKGVTQGTVLVDPVTGKPVSTVEDSNGVRRIAVDGNFVAQNVQAEVNLDSDEDEVAVEDPDTGAHIRVENDGSINANVEVDAADGDNIGLKVQERNLAPSDSQYSKRVTAKTGTIDTDTTSIDVSLHDANGNRYNEENPLDTIVKSSQASLSSFPANISSIILLPANPDRKGFYLYNDSAQPCFIAFAATATMSAFTVRVAANTFQPFENITYTGTISGIWNVATGNMRVTELT